MSACVCVCSSFFKGSFVVLFVVIFKAEKVEDFSRIIIGFKGSHFVRPPDVPPSGCTVALDQCFPNCGVCGVTQILKKDVECRRCRQFSTSNQ